MKLLAVAFHTYHGAKIGNLVAYRDFLANCDDESNEKFTIDLARVGYKLMNVD